MFHRVSFRALVSLLQQIPGRVSNLPDDKHVPPGKIYVLQRQRLGFTLRGICYLGCQHFIRELGEGIEDTNLVANANPVVISLMLN